MDKRISRGMFGAVNDTLRCYRNQGTGTRWQTLAGPPSLSELSTEVAIRILLCCLMVPLSNAWPEPHL